MKRVITMLLALSVIVCMMSGLAVSAAEATQKITIDGDISDWEGINAIKSTNGDAEYTFYGVVTEEGLYVACDAYTAGFDPGTGNWWDAPNLEFFVGPFTGTENQRWVSFTDKNGGFVKENNVTTAAVSYETVEGAVTNHAIAEAFIARAQLDSAWFYADGSIRVGMAFDTNNSANAAYVMPTNTSATNNRALVTSDGVYSMSDYVKANSTSLFATGSEWKYRVGTWTNGAAPAAPEGWPGSISSDMLTGTAPMADEWATNENPNDGTQTNAYLWVSKEVEVADLDAVDGKSLFATLRYDDDIKLYVNGTLVYQHSDWNDGYVDYMLAIDASDLLKEGTNVISASLHQHFGGYDFDMGLFVSDDAAVKNSLLPMFAEVDTADELMAYVAAANEASRTNPAATRLVNLIIKADIDLGGEEWTPLDRWIGVIEGSGKTVSGLTYETDAGSGNFGLIVKDLANYNAYGTVQNLTVKDSVIIAKTTNGYVGGIAGYADRGRVMNCTVENVTVIGNSVSGGIVGGACWATGSLNGQWVIEIVNNTVKNSAVVAVNTEEGKAGAIAGINYWDDIVSLGDYTLENVEVIGKTTSATIADTQGRTPPQGENATSSGVSEKQTVPSPALGEDQAAKAWDAKESSEIRIEVTAIKNTLSAVKINGNELESSDYTVSETENGFDIVLTEAYLKSLKTDTYKVAIETYLGNVSEVTLSVTDSNKAPATGDTAVAIAIVAFISAFALAAVDKKRKSV